MDTIGNEIINVRFITGWDVCNYACEYCIAGQQNKEGRRAVSQWKADNFEIIIDKIKKLSYRINIRLGAAGEPFLSDVLLRGAAELSNADNVVSVNMITNLSFSENEYKKKLEKFNKEKTAIVASYHYTQIKDMAMWMSVARYLNAQYDFSVVLVAYPSAFDQISELKSKLEDQGLVVFVQPFIGNYNGRELPKDWTEEEKAILKKLIYSRHDYEFLVNQKAPGLCYAGFKSFNVNSDGVAYSCGIPGSEMTYVGNLIESEKLNLFQYPKPCIHDKCLCDTENMNTVCFEQYYVRNGINQHKYSYRFKEEAALYSDYYSEWKISY